MLHIFYMNTGRQHALILIDGIKWVLQMLSIVMVAFAQKKYLIVVINNVHCFIV